MTETRPWQGVDPGLHDARRRARRASPLRMLAARLSDVAFLRRDEGGGAGDGQAEGHDGERHEDVERAVEVDRHSFSPI